VVALPDGARALLELEAPEAIVEVWRARHQLGRRVIAREVDGYLVLTSQRVVFVQVVGVGHRRTYHLLPRMSFRLEHLTELREDPPGSLRVSGSDFRVAGVNAYGACDLIERCRVARLNALAPMGAIPSRGPSGATVTERIIVREIVKVPCRYCGALVDHGANRCPACGAPVSR